MFAALVDFEQTVGDMSFSEWIVDDSVQADDEAASDRRNSSDRVSAIVQACCDRSIDPADGIAPIGNDSRKKNQYR